MISSKVLDLTRKQREFGFDRCARQLESGNKRCLLQGECGIGKTLISCIIAKEKYNKKPVLLMMENQYIKGWIDTLKVIHNGEAMDIVTLEDEHTWDTGSFLVVNTDMMRSPHLNNLYKLVQFYARRRVFQKPFYVFFDLNYFFYNTVDEQSQLKVKSKDSKQEKKSVGLGLTRPMMLYWHAFYFMARVCGLVITDEMEIMRSSADAFRRTLFKDVLTGSLHSVPVLMNTATPFGGMEDDNQQVADFLGVTSIDSMSMKEICKSIQERMVCIKKQDVLDDPFPPLAVYAVNVDQSDKWLTSEETNFIHAIVHLECSGIDDDLFHISNVCAAVASIKECLLQYKKLKTRLLMTVERVLFAVLIRFLAMCLFFENPEEMFENMKNIFVTQARQDNKRLRQGQAKENLFKEYFVKTRNGGVLFKRARKISIDKKFYVETCTDALNRQQSLKVMPAAIAVDDDSMQKQRLALNTGNYDDGVLLCMIQTQQKGSRGWNCVPDDGGYVVHIAPQGISCFHTNLLQMLSRTNRFNSKGVSTFLAFMLFDQKSLERNVGRCIQKHGRILEVTASSPADEEVLEDLTASSAADVKISENLETLSSKNFETLLFERPKSFHAFPGILPLEPLSHGMETAE